MITLHVKVTNKVAVHTQRDREVICANNDYQVEFTFDREWDGINHKTARFIWNGEYYDVEFIGTTCPMPEIRDATIVEVGVYAGELHTTTPAIIQAARSILCNGTPANPNYGENYTNEAIAAAERAEAAAERAEHAADYGAITTNTETPIDGVLKGENGHIAAATPGVDFGNYNKPAGGIPLSDLADEVLNKLVARDAGGMFIVF